MMMTQEQVLERLALLQRERDAMLARLSAIEGAIMENKHWLELHQKSEAEAKKKPGDPNMKPNGKTAPEKQEAKDARPGA